MKRAGVTFSTVLAVLFGTATVGAQEAPAAGSGDTAASRDALLEQQERARSHFDLGVSHFDREEWDAALVEFERSREILPTKGNIKNAAICLRKVGRFEEALELFELLGQTFPDLGATDRALVTHEIAELSASVGTLDVEGAPQGASVSVDAAQPKTTPLPGPMRVSAGSHVVRVTRDGFLPFEQRIELAGRQALVVHATLEALVHAGRLKVVERDQRPLTVVVDGVPVGATPWEGALTPGRHTVLGRGEGSTAALPRSVDVPVDRQVSVTLAAAELPAVLRLEVHPSAASLFVDGVPVGGGSWQGRLGTGHHRVVASLDGYLTQEREVVLNEDVSEKLVITLESANQPHPSILVDLGALFGSWGGDLGACAACSSSIPLGVRARAHFLYGPRSGFGFGAGLGYLLFYESYARRPESLRPVGLPPDAGLVSDSLRLGGLTVAAEGQYRTRGAWPLTVALGVGLWLGQASDARAGTFTDSTGAAFGASANQSLAADSFFFAPELRLAHALGGGFEASIGVEALFLLGLDVPRWDTSKVVAAGHDGEGSFPADRLAGPLVVLVSPDVGLRYAF